MNDKEFKCKNCINVDKHEVIPEYYTYRCMYNPPVYKGFPSVQEDDWCTQYYDKEGNYVRYEN